MKATLNAFLLLPLSLIVALTGKAQETNLKPGLQAEYFDLSPDWLPFPKIYEDFPPEMEHATPTLNFDSSLEPMVPGAPADFFVARWDGWIKIPANGTYKFHLESDDGSRLYLDGRLKLKNDGLHPMLEKTESVELTAGDHEIQVELFDFTSTAGGKLFWTVPDGEKEIVPAEKLFHRTKGSDGPQPGLLGKYFNLFRHWQTFPRLDPFKAPVIKRVEANVDFNEANLPADQAKDFFVILWKGQIQIPSEGDYTFYLASDDGSRLFIDGREIVSNGGHHGVRERSGNANLSKGDHNFIVEYFEVIGGASCKLFWESSEIAREIVPTSAFVHDENKLPAVPRVVPEIKAANQPAEKHLKIWLKFEQADSVMADDASENGNSAALSGDPVPTAEGKVGGCLQFDGMDDYGKLPEETFDFTGGITVALWARPTAMKLWARFIDFGNGSNGDNIILGRRATSNDLFFEIYEGQATRGLIVAPAALEFDVWQHFAATVDPAGKVAIYKNGALLVERKTVMPRTIKRANNYVGRSNWEQDKFYEGAMDDLRVYDRALTAEEIKSLAGEGLETK